MALADTLKEAGHIAPGDWAKTLGAALREAGNRGALDTEDTYYHAALTALERLAEQAGITAEARLVRKTEWEMAYLRTPHGKPVTLEPSD